MKNITLLIATLLFLGTTQAQTSWNTLLGGLSHDIGYEMDMDVDGNIYVVGVSNGTWGSPIRTYQGGVSDAFVAKLSENGALLWVTFLGGPGEDMGHSIVVDQADGSVYVSGQSRLPWGASTLVEPYRGGWDGFVAKLNSNGVLQWNSFVGNEFTAESAYDIALSGSTLYITGGGGAQASFFIGKINTAGNLLGYDVFGPTDLIGFEIKLSPGGILYVFGYSALPWDTLSWWGSPVENYHGDGDAFLAAFDVNAVFGNNSNHGLLWYTFLGCGGNDGGFGLYVDNSDNAYVSGFSNCTWGLPVSTYVSGLDGFLAKYNSSGTREWNTFVGDWAVCVIPGSDSTIYLSGQTYNGPFVAQYDRGDGTQLCLNTIAPNTGGGARNLVYRNGTVYATGESYASWGTPIDPYAGNSDISVFKIGACNISASAGSDQHIYTGYSTSQCITRTVAVTGGTGPLTYNWTLDRTLLPGESISGANTGTVTVCLTDTAELCVTVTGGNCCSSSDCIMVFVEDVRCYAGNSQTQKVTICHNENTVCVVANTVPVHLAHGDYLGSCTTTVMRERDIDIEHNERPKLSISPNPASSQFTVRSDRNKALGIVRIFDQSGKTVYQSFITGPLARVNVSHLPPGVYYLKSDEVTDVFKFVKL